MSSTSDSLKEGSDGSHALGWGGVGWRPDGEGVGRERGGGKSNRRRRHGGCGFLEEQSLRQRNGGRWDSSIY
jgi:hypothetical protein